MSSIGVCYFPEQWPRERWESDVDRMAEAGVEYVRMGEFSWAVLEPEPGGYDFEWLDRAVELVADRGMRAVLCTPTATPPKWLVDEHPEIRQEADDGTVRDFGSRRHYCFNSPAYRRESERIVREMAERYADHPGVVGWQTDNEFGCHDTVRCYCDDCASAFRTWLRERYDGIDDLNERWGTTFWSQTYGSFAAVDPPRHTTAPEQHHPARLLDYARFASDSVVDYNRLHASILRAANGEWFVTHNFMGDFDPLDAGAVSGDLDFASWDSYPTLHGQRAGEADPGVGGVDDETTQRAGDPDVTGLNHALYRGASDAPFWVMENQSGDVRAYPYSAEPETGMMRLWAHAAVAQGAGTVSYFRWRRCRYGQEQYWGALCNFDGEPDRGLPEAAAAAEEFDGLGELGDVDAPVALLHDYDSLWAIEGEAHSPDYDHWAHLRTYYRALRRRGVTVDVVAPDADLSGYEAVVAPGLYVADDAVGEHLASYVAAGGELLLGARTGYVDDADTVHEGLAPGPLADAVGARVEQHESLAPAVETRVAYDGDEYDYRVWGEWLAPDGGEVRGEHRSGPGAGEPACVRNEHGDGAATYLGVWPGEALADAVVTDLLGDRARADPLPDRVRLTARGELTWVLNHGPDPVEIDVPDGAEIRVGDTAVGGFDLAVVEAAPEDVAIE